MVKDSTGYNNFNSGQVGKSASKKKVDDSPEEKSGQQTVDDSADEAKQTLAPQTKHLSVEQNMAHLAQQGEVFRQGLERARIEETLAQMPSEAEFLAERDEILRSQVAPATEGLRLSSNSKRHLDQLTASSLWLDERAEVQIDPSVQQA